MLRARALASSQLTRQDPPPTFHSSTQVFELVVLRLRNDPSMDPSTGGCAGARAAPVRALRRCARYRASPARDLKCYYFASKCYY
jgi:hypothetical protein